MRSFPWTQAVTRSFALFKAHPQAVGVWMMIAFCREFTFTGIVAAVFALMNQPSTAAWALGPVGRIGYAALAFLIPQMFSAVLVAAVFRALLKPGESKGRFVRLGLTELLMLALIVIASVVVLVVGLAVTLIVGWVTSVLGHPLLLGTVAFIAALGAVLAIIRFAPAPAMVVDRGRIRLLQAWKATRGAYLPLVLILVPAMLAQELVRDLPHQFTPQWRSLPWDGASRLGMDLWVAVTDVLFLVFGAGVIAVVYRAGAQTPD
jgi:hypothetical protein